MIKTFLNKILNSKNSRTKAIKQNIAGSLLVKGISIALDSRPSNFRVCI